MRSLLDNPPRFHFSFFFFNDTATTEIYTLSLHDALPISSESVGRTRGMPLRRTDVLSGASRRPVQDRKSTRLNSSHGYISYAVFCLKKKKKNNRSQASAQEQPKQKHERCSSDLNAYYRRY